MSRQVASAIGPMVRSTNQESGDHTHQPAPANRRIGLMLVLLAAAMPFRFPTALGVAHSVSILDVLLIIAALGIAFGAAATHRLELGYGQVFVLLAVPVCASALSILWSQDPVATARSTLIYVEGMVAYLFVVKATAGLAPMQVLTYMKRLVYLLILPGILLLLHVPGFEPQDQGLSLTSADYLSYYSRLSHPLLGRSNNLATLLAFLVLPLIYWGARTRNARFTRAGVVALVGVFLTLSRGVVLAVAVCGLLYWLLSLGDRRGPSRGRQSTLANAAAVAGLIGGAVLLLYLLNPATNEFFTSRLGVANLTERLDFIGSAFNKILQSPVVGYGAGVVPDGDPGLALGVHNTYLQQVVYYGIPLGVMVGMSLVMICLFFFSRQRQRMAARVLGLAVLTQLLSFVVEASFEGTVLKVLFFLFIGLAVGLLRSIEARPDRPVAAAPLAAAGG
jgi:O-antigen ligase/polysaccharide polymerase Wzy-like membrane protein